MPVEVPSGMLSVSPMVDSPPLSSLGNRENCFNNWRSIVVERAGKLICFFGGRTEQLALPCLRLLERGGGMRDAGGGRGGGAAVGSSEVRTNSRGILAGCCETIKVKKK